MLRDQKKDQGPTPSTPCILGKYSVLALSLGAADILPKESTMNHLSLQCPSLSSRGCLDFLSAQTGGGPLCILVLLQWQ